MKEIVVSRRLLAILGFASLAALAACEGPIEPVGTVNDNGFEVRSSQSLLRLTNRRSAPVFTFVVGAEAAARINWAPCVDAAACPPIAPGASMTVHFPDGIDGAVETQAVVNWWHAVPGPDGSMKPDSIRAIVIGR